MDISNYPPPVDKLLTYGDCQDLDRKQHQWPDYLELGFGPEHIPDLIRMATDEELYQAYDDTLESSAPTHAWRTLGQLRAEAAIEPLWEFSNLFRTGVQSTAQEGISVSGLPPFEIAQRNTTAHKKDKGKDKHKDKMAKQSQKKNRRRK